MEKILLIAMCVSSLFITSAYCCLLSGSGEYGGPCSSVGRQPFSYGGRIALVERGAGLLAPPPWANQRIFVFRMPLSLSKIKHRRSIFGHKGIIGITSDGAPCAGHIPVTNDCPSTTQDFTSVCLDPTLPCYKTPPSYNQSEPLSHSNITSTSITVTWPPWDEDVDVGNGPIVDYIIEMRKVGDAVFTKICKGIQFSHRFDNLDENTEYEFRITVVRDHPFGEGQPSNIQRCNTSSTIEPEPEYTNREPLVFQDVTSSSVTVSWPEWDPTVDRGTGPVTGYKILYREQGRRRWQTILLGELSTQLTGLLEHTTYELVIKLGYGSDSFSTRTNVQTVTTKCRDIDGIDLQLSSLSTTSGYATISAQWSFGSSETCVVRQNLTIQQLDSDGCRDPPSPGEFSLEASLGGKIRSLSKKHLEAYSEYNVSITVMTVTNDIYYQSKKIRTSSSEPTGKPLNVRREETTPEGRVILRWDKPACGSRHGEIERYEFEFRRKDGSNIIRKGSTKNHRKRFLSLDVGDKYSFRVRAVTDKGFGPWRIIVRTFGQ